MDLLHLQTANRGISSLNWFFSVSRSLVSFASTSPCLSSDHRRISNCYAASAIVENVSLWLLLTLVLPSQVVTISWNIAEIPAVSHGPNLGSKSSVGVDTATIQKRWIADRNAQTAAFENINEAYVQAFEIEHERAHSYTGQPAENEVSRRLMRCQESQLRTLQALISASEVCLSDYESIQRALLKELAPLCWFSCRLEKISNDCLNDVASDAALK